jgi:hypothetical protein
MKKDKELVRRLKWLCEATVFFLLFSFSARDNALGQSTEEYAVKAAFVLNFARYTQWPEDAFGSPVEPFKLCVIGKRSIVSAFQALNGKKIDARTLVVCSMVNAEDLESCHLIFISEGVDRTTLVDTLAAVKGKPVLTIGETKAFTNSGGIINFFSRKGRLHFEINETIAREHHLKLSSRLLKLAIIVGDK